jgi:hemerythrin
MTVIKWRDSFNTGVRQFDLEHHKIVELINAMYLAMRDKAGRDEVEKLVSELVAYTRYHFENEESAMTAAHYPQLEDHRAEHERLRAEVVNFEKLIKEDFDEGTRDFYRFLRQWLKEHIMECDMLYSGKL